MLLLSSTSSFPVTQPSLLTSSSSSSSAPSSLSSSLSLTEVKISDGTASRKSEEEKSKMSRCFIGWMIFACLDFFFFVPGGFLLAILGYNCQSTAMMVSGAILIFVFFVVIPGFGISLVVRKQYRDTNKFISMTNRVRKESTISQQSAPPSCIVSTSGNNFHDFSRRPSHETGDLGVTSGVVADYRSCHDSDAIHGACPAAVTAIATTQTTQNLTTSTAEATSIWTNNFISNILASRSSQRCGYVELP